MIRNTLIFPILFIISASLWAEQKKDFGAFELHYIVLNTTEIPAEVAQNYGIVRSGKRAFINLSLLQKTDDHYGIPTGTEITARQRSLIGQQSKIKLEEIREGDAIYYIGTFQILNREILWFDIDFILPNGRNEEFSFSQQVWQE